MEVTRTSLRAQRNKVPKQVAQGQTQQKGGYGEEVKKQGQEIFNIRSERPVIQAKRVDPIVSPTVEYTEDAVKTALKEELKKFISSRGLGEDTSGATEQTASFAGGGGGGKGFFSGDNLGNLSYKNMPFVPEDQYKGVETDNLRYGDTMPEGAFGIGSKATDDFSGLDKYQSTAGDFAREQEKEKYAKLMSSLPSDYKQTEQRAFDDAEAYRKLVASGLDKTVGGQDAQVNVGSGRLGSFGLGTAGEGAPSGDALKPGSFGISTIKREDQAERMGGQGGLALGTTTQRQGGTVKDGIKVAKKESPAVNASSFLQKNVRGGGKDESARPAQVKQTVASLPSNYKQTEAKAFAKSKSYQDSKSKGQAAAKATGIQTKPKAGSFGISEAGKKQAEANKKEAAEAKKRAEAKKVAEAAKKKKEAAEAKKKNEAAEAKRKEAKKKSESQKKKTTKKKSSPSTSKSGRKSGSKKSSRGARGGSSSRSRGGAGKKGGSTGGSKKSSRGAKGGSSSRSRGGTSKGGARTNRRRSRRRCDIRCKFDISILTNQNLIRDDLADVAYFVKDLQEIN